MKPVNIAVVGTNFVSDWFCETARAVSGVEVVAVYSRKLDTGAAFAEKHGIKFVYDSYADMLCDDRVDAVYVASPTMLHCEHTVMALEKGKHVLCEKAIATSYSEFRKMREAAERSGRVLLEAMRPAHDPFYDGLLSAIEDVKGIKEAHLSFEKYSSRYDKFKAGVIENAFNPEMKNSALSDIGIYPLWLSVRLFGAPKHVVASSNRLSNGFDGSGTVMLFYDDIIPDVTVTYSKINDGVGSSYISTDDSIYFIDRISEPTELSITRQGDLKRIRKPDPCENNMIYEIEAFRDMINGDRDFKPYLDESDALMRTYDMVVAAQKQNDTYE